ncbi:hypothetical protein CMI37_12460 [Candidatus Pacearchaeota archaeon]|jgi:hypothetical protein|nr:hypothetical protein [Candidatus Pacearchaeota archaeon]|tara:strand:+ start:801 stop:989 length:189 start_codon:yes stop_codon:yes gene_type:complete
MSDNILALLRKKINDEVSVLSDHLASGAVSNMEEYRRTCGKIEGCEWVYSEIVELEKRLDEF